MACALSVQLFENSLRIMGSPKILAKGSAISLSSGLSFLKSASFAYADASLLPVATPPTPLSKFSPY